MDARTDTFSVQERALRAQAHELDTALRELADAPRAYAFVSGLLLERDRDTLLAELRTRRESVSARLDALARSRSAAE